MNICERNKVWNYIMDHTELNSKDLLERFLSAGVAWAEHKENQSNKIMKCWLKEMKNGRCKQRPLKGHRREAASRLGWKV